MLLPMKMMTRLTGINWPLIGLVVLLQVLWTYHWYNRGADSCIDRQASALVTSVNERLPVVQQAERGAAQLEQELRTIRERLDEEAKRPYAADCSVTDEQLQLYRSLSEKTQR